MDLVVQDLAVSYGGIRAVDGVSITASTRELVCILGANGAGKSSLLNAIVGLVRHQEGTVHIDGQRIDKLPAHRIARRGITLVPEGRMVFSRLSVKENLLLAGRLHQANVGTSSDRALESVIERFPMLVDRLDAPAGLLSGGQQQMLVIGRALMTGAPIILLDEPSLGLAPLVVVEVFDLLRQLREQEGLTIVLVEQNARQALAVSDRGYVMRNGRVVGAGTATELRDSGMAEEAYLGKAAERTAVRGASS